MVNRETEAKSSIIRWMHEEEGDGFIILDSQSFEKIDSGTKHGRFKLLSDTFKKGPPIVGKGITPVAVPMPPSQYQPAVQAIATSSSSTAPLPPAPDATTSTAILSMLQNQNSSLYGNTMPNAPQMYTALNAPLASVSNELNELITMLTQQNSNNLIGSMPTFNQSEFNQPTIGHTRYNEALLQKLMIEQLLAQCRNNAMSNRTQAEYRSHHFGSLSSTAAPRESTLRTPLDQSYLLQQLASSSSFAGISSNHAVIAELLQNMARANAFQSTAQPTHGDTQPNNAIVAALLRQIEEEKRKSAMLLEIACRLLNSSSSGSNQNAAQAPSNSQGGMVEINVASSTSRSQIDEDNKPQCSRGKGNQEHKESGKKRRRSNSLSSPNDDSLNSS
eukprot:scaffold570_cov169-Alexandrium_tamarense.AAC.5